MKSVNKIIENKIKRLEEYTLLHSKFSEFERQIFTNGFIQGLNYGRKI